MKAVALRVSRALDALIELSGRTLAWLVVALVGVTVYDVAMRYFLRQGSVAIQELEWHLFAAIFLLAGAYTLRHDAHVRVDMLYRSRFVSARGRRLIDIAGTLLFTLPFSVLVVWAALPFVSDAFVHGEMSPDPGGLPWRWAAKALIPLGFGLICLQAAADLLRAVAGSAEP